MTASLVPRKLLVLDLDETLFYATETPLARSAEFRVGPYHAYRRPFLEPFLADCFEHFEVGVWTSASAHYATAVVSALFPPHTPPAFIWSEARCSIRFDPETNEHCPRKRLKKLVQKGYRREHIIAVDDTPEKWAESYGNLVPVRPFYGDVHDNELPRLARFLITLAGVENVRTLEKRGWRGREGAPATLP